MSSSSISGDHALKKMRKGTRSCLECRKRKIRCVWQPTAEKCRGCSAREATCLAQAYGDTPLSPYPRRKRMRQRINELENTISRVAQGLADAGINATDILSGLDGQFLSPSDDERSPPLWPQGIDAPSFAGIALSDDLGGATDNAPLLTLLDNEILATDEVASTHLATSRHSSGGSSNLEWRYTRIFAQCKLLVPNTQLLSLLLHHSYLPICLLKNFTELQTMVSNGFDVEALSRYIVESFSLTDAARLTQVMICLATCIQQLPCNVQVSSLDSNVSLVTLGRHYMDYVEAFLAPDEGIVGSIDGLSCLLSLVTFYVHAGLPRKGWIIFRRAASLAQLLGPCHQRSSDQQIDMRQRGVWVQMWQTDKSLSVLLGLPDMISALPFKLENNADPSFTLPPRILFIFKLGSVGARVISRNAQDLASMSYSETLQIDQDLQQCRTIMPQSWWDIVPDSNMALATVYEMFTIKFWYHNLRNLVHIPFFLKSIMDSTYQFSNIAALGSSREIVRFYEIMRDVNRPVVRLCNMMDFQVLTAALIILIPLLGSSLTAHDPAQEEQDWQVIYNLIEVMKRAAEDVPNTVAAQASELLEDLISLRYDSVGTQKIFQVTVPYFGKIQIRSRMVGGSDLSQPPKLRNSGTETQASLQRDQNIATSGFEIPGFELSNYPGFEDAQAWPGFGEDWASAVDFSLLDDWDWSLNESG